MEFAAGIDGGGTKTVAVISDRKGNVLGRGIGGPSNYQVVGVERAVDAICYALDQAMAAVGRERVFAVWAGLAGVNTRHDVATMTAALEHEMPGVRLAVDNDAYNCLASAIDGSGVAVISGTGSIAVGVNGQVRARAGGWGFIAGDEGSGYDIGRQALMACCRADDGRGQGTILTDIIMKRLFLRDIDDLYVRLYGEGLQREQISALAEDVASCAAKGDAVANEILDKAGSELGLAAAAVCQTLKMAADPVSVALCGGVFSIGTPVVWPLVKTLRRKVEAARVFVPEVEPVMGAVKLAWQLGEE